MLSILTIWDLWFRDSPRVCGIAAEYERSGKRNVVQARISQKVAVSVVFVAVNLLADIAYAKADPRVAY